MQLVLRSMGDLGDLPTDQTPLSVFRTSVKSTELLALLLLNNEMEAHFGIPGVTKCVV